MFHRCLHAYAEKVCRLVVVHYRTVVFHGVCVREISPYKLFELVFPDKFRTVGHDALKKRLVSFIPPQLPLPVPFSCDIDRVKSDRIGRHGIVRIALRTVPPYVQNHVRIEFQLQIRAYKRLRHSDFELNLHLSEPFGHIPESCRDFRRHDYVRSCHFSGLAVPYCIHYQRTGLFHGHGIGNIHCIHVPVRRRCLRHDHTHFNPFCHSLYFGYPFSCHAGYRCRHRRRQKDDKTFRRHRTTL